jgi:hypothetical protein
MRTLDNCITSAGQLSCLLVRSQVRSPVTTLLVIFAGNTSSSTVWYSLGFIESCQGVKRGDIVWQVTERFTVHCQSFWEGLLWRGCKCSTDESTPATLGGPSGCCAGGLTAGPPLQVGFGSGFKCNSAVWRALRPVSDVHAAWDEHPQAMA